MTDIRCPKCGTVVQIDKILEDQAEARILASVKKQHDDELKTALEQAEAAAKAASAEESRKAVERALKVQEAELENLRRDKEADETYAKELREAMLKDKEELRVIRDSLENAKKQHDEELRAAIEQAEAAAKAASAEDSKKAVERALKAQEVELENLRKDKEADEAAAKDLREKMLKDREEMRKIKESLENAQLAAEQKIAEETERIRKESADRARDSYELKIKEMEKQLGDTKTALAEAQKKAEQGSQQNQGEVLELELETCLRSEFPHDSVDEVKKGVRGADMKQTVNDVTGECGLILWETKNAKWQPGWIKKFKDDIREANATIGILVSANLPEDYGEMQEVEGVWVVKPRFALPVARIIREQIVGVHKANVNAQGKDAKVEMLYAYLTGTEFKHRIEAILENYKTLQDEINKEKRAAEKRWAKQEKAIEAVIRNTSGMYGDFQGLIGSAMGEIKLLESDEEE